MKFSEELAKKIIAQHALSEKTLRVWKTRGQIPEKYNNANFVKREVSNVATIRQSRLLDLLKTKTINIQTLAELAGIPVQRIYDALNGDVLLADADLKLCVNEIKRLKIEIARTFERFQPARLKRLFQNPLIRYSKVVDSPDLHHKISYIRKGKAEPDKRLFLLVKDKYILFALTLNL